MNKDIKQEGISIILPVYNGERYLEESIKSVLAQTYGNFELIIFDDGSTDTTYSIAATFNDSRIRIFRNDVNQGLFRTLNLAINKAGYKFIRLWSYDDIMKSECLQTEMDFHKAHPDIAMSYCAREAIDALGNKSPEKEDRTPEIILPDLAAQIMFYYGSITGNISTVMIKKDILIEMGRFREDMMQSADFQMWVRVSAKYPIGFIRRSIMYLRCHGAQYSKWEGMGIVFIKEDGIVFSQLMKRLPKALSGYVFAYSRHNRYVKYVQYMVRCLLRADFKTAAQVYRELVVLDNILLLVFFWFVSGGGRWFRKPPRFVYDNSGG